MKQCSVLTLSHLIKGVVQAQIAPTKVCSSYCIVVNRFALENNYPVGLATTLRLCELLCVGVGEEGRLARGGGH